MGLFSRIARALLVVCSFVVEAQSSGEIRVEVVDASGSAVAATGLLESLSTGLRRSFRADAQGSFTLADLPFGRYRLRLSKEGFSTHVSVIEVSSSTPVVKKSIPLALGVSTYAVSVAATTPLAGFDRPVEEIPGPAQTASQRDIEASGALDLSDFLNRRLNNVYLNEIQGNPFQPDLNYRGYSASPLLGTPQGVSVYMDGVRLNQPFGEVVSWDLIPLNAISEVALIPGSNPLFGLNTLGGALSLQTKDGRTNGGTELELSGGSFGRRQAQLEHGGSNTKGFHWFVASSLLFENGWRVQSPSNIRQFFGKVGWQGTRTSIALTASYANNQLNGNALQEQRFIVRDYTSIYNYPDVNTNRSPLVNLNLRHSFGKVSLSGNAYYRYIGAATFNADVNQDALTESVYQPSAADIAALRAAGYNGFPTSGANAGNTPFPFWRCIAQVLQKDEPVEKCNGLFNRSATAQHNGGLAGQVNWFASSAKVRHQFTAGAAWDQSSVNFQQSQQFAYLNPDHSFTPVNAFADGTTNSNGEPYDTRVNLDGRIHTASVYASGTLSSGAWALTYSGRYNRTVVDNKDALHRADEPGSLTSRNPFGRFNPAIGFTFNPNRLANFYANYSEGSRAPASVELGCADPDQPCKLPNAMAADPPLQQVVTRTVEAGVRGSTENNLHWSAGWFRGQNSNDILFVASSQTGFGYFKNFGTTLRQGVELDLDARLRRVTAGLGYTYLLATFDSPESVNGSGNSSNDADIRGTDGLIHITPGNRIPLVPCHMFKAHGDWTATSRLTIDAGAVATSGVLARGNENGLHQPDGKFYLGPGSTPAYGVLHLGARYRVHRKLELFVRVNNVLDQHYYSAAQLQTTAYTDSGAYIARPFGSVNGGFPLVHATFYAPGAPRGAWGGIRIQF